MHSLEIKNIGQIRKASLTFGDLTVLVGPQASGKSIALQWLKLLQDTGLIQEQLHNYGLDYGGRLPDFLDVYFGEGMRSIWRDGSEVQVDGKAVDVGKRIGRKQPTREETAFLIPAQRVLALATGWPKPFTAYAAGDPYAVRAYSEKLRLLMEQEFSGSGPLFPRANRLKADYRKLLQDSVFANFRLSVDKVQSQKRLVLGPEKGSALPYMVWSAGQREFVPLLLGLYWLMPPARVARRGDIDWVVIEELEMGLHPRAIATVLLIVLELLARGYRVCLSTHSTQVLELVWAWQALRQSKMKPVDLLRLFAAPSSQSLREMATTVMGKSSKVYYFDPSGIVQDITALSPTSDAALEASWGGLLDFTTRANDAVARAAVNAPNYLGTDLAAGAR